MARLKIVRYGTRAEVMHGKARMTQGRLRKDDLTYNEYGQIVSKVRQKAMKSKKNPLRKLGLLQAKKKGTKKGTFGPKNKSSINRKSNTGKNNNKNKSKNTNKNKSKKSNKKK